MKILKIISSLFITLILLACASESNEVVSVEEKNTLIQTISNDFAGAIVAEDFSVAYNLTSDDFKSKTSVEKFKADYENMLGDSKTKTVSLAPDDATIELSGKTPELPSEIGSAYIPIHISTTGEDRASEDQKEAIAVTVIYKDKKTQINSVEFGRP